MVRTQSYDWIVKEPKSYAGDRYIEYPDFIVDKWKGINGRIVKLTPDNISTDLNGF